MNTKEYVISKTWRTSKNKESSILTVIPAKYAQRYGLGEPTNVMITPTDKGLLLRKLEI
jgi:hypothetical protein